MDQLHRALADRIRELADEREIALTHLADRAGTSRSHLWAVLRGEASPTLAWMQKIALVLDVSVIELLGRRAANPEAPMPSGRIRHR